MTSAVDQLRLMARNNAYANSRLYEACNRLSQLEFLAARTNFFPSIKDTLNHLWEVDRYYLDALREQGEGLSVFDVPFLQTASELWRAQKKVDHQLIGFCDDLGETDLDREICHDRGKAGQIRETVGNTLLHLFQHQIHHRGQVHAMLAGTHAAPPQLDEFFLKFERHPAAEDLL
ncbi:putative damage-inducible protein DinB [Roseibium hamelinense]|uniref:Putative damage-inducible protein DinB n=1 Tax=Roseibium hamelinense TaxID=150831 RepID=A0A562SVP7_9HYPH|nr:DinB family protein [Roseibium hamelinense]MTI42548.1 damage-inducible protein DinB [Roseibium hamelinense]TWI84810.1 putative damage-inducible protein DinB [Roseibium hamelinense]